MGDHELKARISTALSDRYSKDHNDIFYDEVYVDYNDELPNEAAKEILRSEIPMDVLSDKLSEWYQESVWQLEDEAIKTLRADPELDMAYIQDPDQFRDVLFDLFYVSLPYDHYLSQPVNLVVALDTGNFNVDCTLDGFAHGYYGRGQEEVDPHSSLLWLCEQQGVTKETLEQALRTGICYPKDVSDLLCRHQHITRQMKDLGYVPNKPMDQYNQKGAFKTLSHAENNIRNRTRLLEKYHDNLEDCNLTYEQFCKKWYSVHTNRVFDRTPPSQEDWENRREETRNRLTNAIAATQSQLVNDKKHLEEVLSEPGPAAAAKLRNELNLLTEPVAAMKQSEVYQKGRFLESVLSESANVTSHMNTLTALLKLNLHQAIKLAEVVNGESHLNKSFFPDKRTGRSSIHLSKDTILGLYDPWFGSGSLFDIKLHKPLEVPVRLIHDANIDGNLGYSIESIYGGMDFGETLEDICAVPPENKRVPLNQTIQNAQSKLETLSEEASSNPASRNTPPER